MDNILTLKQVGEKLQVSESWLYRKVKSGVLPHIRIGRTGPIRVRESELEKWLRGHSVAGKLKV